MNSTLGIAILGCGMIGGRFARAAGGRSDVKVVALCSRSQNSMARVAQHAPAAARYLSREALLEDQAVEAVLVCTPHASHATDAIAAVRSGRHVMIEKPIATTGEELDRLLAAADGGRSAVAVGLPHGEYPYIDGLRRASNDTTIGPLVGFESVLDVPGPPRANWYYTAEAGGGASLDTMPYALCRLLAFTQSPVSACTGLVTQLIKDRRCLDGGRVTPQVDDNVTLLLTFPEGQHALVRSSWCVSVPRDYVRVFGRHGNLELDCISGAITLDRRDGATEPVGAYPVRDDEQLKLDVFTRAIAAGASNLTAVGYAMGLILRALEGHAGFFAAAAYAPAAADALKGLRMGRGPL